MQCTCGTEMIPMYRRYNMNQLRHDCCAKGIYASPKATAMDILFLLGMEQKETYFSFYCGECGFGRGLKVVKVPKAQRIRGDYNIKHWSKKFKGFKTTMRGGKAAMVRL